VTPILTTERLILRPIALSDAPSIQKNIDDWEVVRELSTEVPWPYPPDGAEIFVRDIVLPAVGRGEKHCWVLVPKEGPNEAIGVLEYRCTPGETDHRGFWLARDWWGRGLMTEAVTAFQDWVFFELGVDELFVCNAVVNVRSRRVKEKTGAVRIGERRVMHHHGDDRVEVWRLTREAWSKSRGRSPG
jgi:RimJ/RimL family protein N-acetyltransferase